jgi:hypothetical protein
MAWFDWWGRDQRSEQPDRTPPQEGEVENLHSKSARGQAALADSFGPAILDRAHLHLTEDQKDALVVLCNECPVAVDSLPYSREFQGLVREFRRRAGVEISHHSVWRAVCGLRKKGRLETKGSRAIEPAVAE